MGFKFIFLSLALEASLSTAFPHIAEAVARANAGDIGKRE